MLECTYQATHGARRDGLASAEEAELNPESNLLLRRTPDKYMSSLLAMIANVK